MPLIDTSTCNVRPNSVHADMMRCTDLFIVDEASMVPTHAITAIDKMLRDVNNVDEPFGGKVLLLGGDFKQVLPVIPKGTAAAIIENCLKMSPLWCRITKLKLIKNMRAAEDEQKFADWLLQLGNGSLESPVDELIGDSIEIPNKCNIVHDIVNAVFPDSNSLCESQSVILTAKNDDSLQINETVLQKLENPAKTYLSTDKVKSDNQAEVIRYPLEFLNNCTPSGMPPHCLNLKVGAIVMLLRNLDIKKGLCNGTRLRIVRLHDHVLDAELLTGANMGERVLIPRIRLAPSDVNLPFILERTQFPIRLSYSMTINKSQGQTFKKVGIYLPTSVFCHGQLYVAFSRAKRFSDIYVKIEESPTQGCFNGTYVTKNVVYKEIL